jgi:hypothetical protein
MQFDLISLSPKLSNSVPREKDGVTIKDIDRHNKLRVNYLNMRKILSNNCTLYCVKFVASQVDDFIEIMDAIDVLSVDNTHVKVMPSGSTNDELDKRRKMIYEECLKRRLGYTDRLHVLIYKDNIKGV